MKKVLTPIAAAIGGALLVGMGPAIWKRVLPDKLPPIEYKVVVYSAAEKTPPIARASVEIRIGTAAASAHETDPQGIATFRIDSSDANKAGNVHVTRAGFQPLDRPITVPLSSAQESIYLDPIVAAAPRSTESKVFSSGPKASGLGSDWSQPYELCSDSPPAGYSIGAVEFALRGDRSCGAWSECHESQRTADKVCWQFRLQGHSEWFPPRPAFSEGILRVTFNPRE
jgi:hypothetical protein